MTVTIQTDPHTTLLMPHPCTLSSVSIAYRSQNECHVLSFEQRDGLMQPSVQQVLREGGEFEESTAWSLAPRRRSHHDISVGY